MKRTLAISSDDQHRQNAQQRNMSLIASEVGSHVFNESQTMDAGRRGSFVLAAGAKDSTRYLRECVAVD